MAERSSNTVRVYYPELSREEIIDRLKEGAELLSKSLPLRAIILFGSYAEGRHTAASDIDLLVVLEDPRRKDDYSTCWDAFKIPQLELHIYTVSEYKMRRSGLTGKTHGKGLVIWRQNTMSPPVGSH